jgi:hypothetical protein
MRKTSDEIEELAMRFGRDRRKNWQRVVGKVRFKSLADRAHATIAFA